jgi:hypothetical protein
LDLHNLLDIIFETIFGANTPTSSTTNSTTSATSHHQPPTLPHRLVYFLQKQLSICPYTFGHSVCKPSPQHDSYSNPDPNNRKGTNLQDNNQNSNNLPLSKQKQVITILRFLCEILIKVLLCCKSILFQFQWPNDILCGVIISSILHLFPLDTKQLSILPRTNPNTFLFQSMFHIEIEKRIQQQLLYFSHPSSTPPDSNHYTRQSLPVHQLPQFNNNNQSVTHTHRTQLISTWDCCYQTISTETFTPWLQQGNEKTTNSNPIHSTQLQQIDTETPRITSPHLENDIIRQFRNAPLSIRSNIPPCSSMSFYDVDATLLYKHKLQQIIHYQSFIQQSMVKPAISRQTIHKIDNGSYHNPISLIEQNKNFDEFNHNLNQLRLLNDTPLNYQQSPNLCPNNHINQPAKMPFHDSFDHSTANDVLQNQLPTEIVFTFDNNPAPNQFANSFLTANFSPFTPP